MTSNSIFDQFSPDSYPDKDYYKYVWDYYGRRWHIKEEFEKDFQISKRNEKIQKIKMKKFNQYITEKSGKSPIRDYAHQLVNELPDSDNPNDIVKFEKYEDCYIYIEGWNENCFSNYGLDSRSNMVDFAKDIYLKRLKEQPNLPQNHFLHDYQLVDHFFVELPNNDVNYCVSVGIYSK